MKNVTTVWFRGLIVHQNIYAYIDQHHSKAPQPPLNQTEAHQLPMAVVVQFLRDYGHALRRHHAAQEQVHHQGLFYRSFT